MCPPKSAVRHAVSPAAQALLDANPGWALTAVAEAAWTSDAALDPADKRDNLGCPDMWMFQTY